MITFIHGTDSYRLKSREREIVASLENAQAPVSHYDLSEREDLNKLINAVKTAGLFSDKETLVVSNGFGGNSAKFMGLIKDYKLADDTKRFAIVTEVGTESSLKKADAELFKFLTSRKCKSEAINPLTDAQLIAWIGIEGTRRGIAIDSVIARRLMDYINDASQTTNSKMGESASKDKTWRLHNEIVKLAHYKNASGNNKVTTQDIELLVNPTLGVSIFELTDSIASRNKAAAAKLLDRTLKNGTDPYYLYSMILYQFRNLLIVKSMMKSAFALPAITSATNLHPFVARKTATAAQRYELQELKNFFTKLADLEISAKTGAIDMTDGLFQFVFGL